MSMTHQQRTFLWKKVTVRFLLNRKLFKKTPTKKSQLKQAKIT